MPLVANAGDQPSLLAGLSPGRAGEGNRTLILSLGRLSRLNQRTTVDDNGRSASRWTTTDVHGRTRTNPDAP